jgi:hypothetical protein
MMKRIRIIGLALVAVSALGAVAVTSASAALPEFKPFKGITFTSKSGPATLETASGASVRCTASSSEAAKLKTAKEVTGVEVKFTGCKLFGVEPCSSKGAAKEEIDTTDLVGEIGYISAASKSVGLALKPKAKKGAGPLATFTCGPFEIEVTGSVIGTVTPVDTATTHFALTYTQVKGIQAPTKFEGEPEDVLFSSLDGVTPEHAGEEIAAEVETSATTEVVA